MYALLYSQSLHELLTKLSFTAIMRRCLVNAGIPLLYGDYFSRWSYSLLILEIALCRLPIRAEHHSRHACSLSNKHLNAGTCQSVCCNMFYTGLPLSWLPPPSSSLTSRSTGTYQTFPHVNPDNYRVRPECLNWGGGMDNI